MILTPDVGNTNGNVNQRKFEHPVTKAFFAGAISGTCSTILFQPLDLVKTRLQSSADKSYRTRGQIATGMLDVFAGIIQKENFFGLWKGITPSLIRCVPGVGVYFASVHWLQSWLVDTSESQQPQLTSTQALGVGVSARAITVVSLLPVTVVKTRFESGDHGQWRSMGVWRALTCIYRSEGVRALASGLAPTLFRDAAFSGLYLVFYSQLKHTLQVQDGDHTWGRFGCGLAAGLSAAFVTQPADVAKTQMQLHPHRFSNTLAALAFVNRTWGVRGHFRGLAPRMWRRALVAAMSWTVYEKVMKSVGLE